jgi:glycosyltransferase involved in cell wall biosynthesis
MEIRNSNVKNEILITIITASYNSAKTIEKTIKSVINQNSDQIEYIIIDGGSNDGTIDIINQYKTHISYSISEADNGIYDAWNKGIIRSNGRYVAFLGSDDELFNNYFETYLPFIENNQNFDFISSKMLIKEKNIIFGFPWDWRSFRKTMNVVHPGSLHNRNLFLSYGLYDDKYKIIGDYEFLLRVGKNLNSYFIDKPTVIFSISGVSSNSYLMITREIRNAKIKNKSRSIFLINLEFINRLVINSLIFIKKTFKII